MVDSKAILKILSRSDQYKETFLAFVLIFLIVNGILRFKKVNYFILSLTL